FAAQPLDETGPGNSRGVDVSLSRSILIKVFGAFGRVMHAPRLSQPESRLLAALESVFKSGVDGPVLRARLRRFEHRHSGRLEQQRRPLEKIKHKHHGADEEYEELHWYL